MSTSFVSAFLGWVALALSSVALVSVVAAFARRWELARRTAKAALIGMLAYPAVMIMLIVRAEDDGQSRAATLARSISHAMNCSSAGVAALVVWVIAARRLRSAQAD